MKIFKTHKFGFGKDRIRYKGAVYRAYKIGWWFIATEILIIEYSAEESIRVISELLAQSNEILSDIQWKT